jgi:hypothetical protein
MFDLDLLRLFRFKGAQSTLVPVMSVLVTRPVFTRRLGDHGSVPAKSSCVLAKKNTLKSSLSFSLKAAATFPSLVNW